RPSGERGVCWLRGDLWWLAGAFVRDELLKPPHLALAGVEAVALQFQGVRVEAFGGAGEDLAQPLPSFLDPPPPAFEDAQPGRLVGAGEEREVHAEPGVVVRLRTGAREQLLEAFLALGGDFVDHPAAAPGQQRDLGRLAAGRRFLRRRLGDPARGLQAPQRRVERAVADCGPERAELGGELLAQLVAVHRGLLQEAEDGEVEHVARPPSGPSMYRADTSSR